MSGCPTKRSLAYPEHSQALCSNQLVARSSAWKYVNHQSTLNIDFPTFFASEQYDILYFRGEPWAWVLLPYGLSAWENRNLCNITSSLHSINLDLDFATLHLTWTLHLYLDLVTLRITRCPFPLPSSSSLAISTSSNHNTWSWYSSWSTA